jgi:hypothetical protein
MRESEMKVKGELSQNKGNKIQFFWEWFNLNKDKLNEFEPHRRFESLYVHLANLSENLNRNGDSNIRKIFVYQMLKSVMSSLCYIAPLPIIIYSSDPRFYEFGVIRGRSGEILSVLLEYDVEGDKATLSSIYKINECNEPVDPDDVENVIMRTGFNHADVLYLEIPGVYRKIRVEFDDDNKIEIRKIEEEE